MKRHREWVRKNRNYFLGYQAKYQKTKGLSLRRKRFEWLEEAKNHPCADCSGRFPPECMDFDHIDPATKLFSVSDGAMGGRKRQLVEDEMAKCRLICSNCHRTRTAAQQKRYRPERKDQNVGPVQSGPSHGP